MNRVRQVDPKAFGRRVRECRLARGMSQEDLATASEQSQSNIDWIEQGKPKKPGKHAYPLAQALTTTPEWLLYAEGQRDSGPVALSPQQVADKYALLSPEEQQEISALVAKHLAEKQKTRKTA